MTLNFKSLMEYYLCKFPYFYSFLRDIAGSKDWEKKTFLKTIMPKWTVIEIGANQGYYTSLFQKLIGESGSLLAFEPIPSTFKLLERSMSCSSQNYKLFNLGTGSEHMDSVEFHLPVNDHGQATMVPHSSVIWQNQKIVKVVCKVVRLDDFEPTKSLKEIHFVKLDTEGAELPTLKGAKALLCKHKPILFFEGCKQWMRSFEYSPENSINF